MGLRLGPLRTTHAAPDRDAEELAMARGALADPRAFAPLYERYLDPVHRHCHRVLGSREAAEDACAITFRKALEGLHAFRYGSFRAWLFTIADNVLRDLARTSHPGLPLSDIDAWAGSDLGPEALTVLADEGERLRVALAALPDEWRRVVLLRLDGLSCAEVAHAIGPHRNEAWVRQAHRRAILRLRALLSGDDPERGGVP
jgi:RNA polymerase sigma-70 factor, ECF subfamily